MHWISRRLCRFILKISTSFTSLSLTSFSSIHDLPCGYKWFFDSVSYNIDEVLSINQSAVFVFGDFNVHHKDWLTDSGETDRPSEIYYNFCILNDLTKMVDFPTWIPDCDSHNPALLDLFTSSDNII